MSKVSTKISELLKYLSEYETIPVNYIILEQALKTGKLASCVTPKENDSQYRPYVKICDISSDLFYKIAKEGDPFGTELIMSMIGQKTEIPEGTEAVIYPVFVYYMRQGIILIILMIPNIIMKYFVKREITNNLWKPRKPIEIDRWKGMLTFTHLKILKKQFKTLTVSFFMEYF